jgi:hypothetical protein
VQPSVQAKKTNKENQHMPTTTIQPFVKSTGGSSNPPDLVLILTVNHFKDVTTAGVMTDKIVKGHGPDVVMVIQKNLLPNRNTFQNNNLHLWYPDAQSASITFEIKPADDYYFAGITFWKTNKDLSALTGSKTPAGRLGLGNFSPCRISDDRKSLSITDEYTEHTVGYKFSIIIQRGSDGKIGMIDPGIIHEN